MACVAFKDVKGNRYVYWTHRVDGVKRQTYCGRASDPRTMRRVRDLELADLRRERDRIDRRIAEIAGMDGRTEEPEAAKAS